LNCVIRERGTREKKGEDIKYNFARNITQGTQFGEVAVNREKMRI
jgi:hypothetical protein